MQHPEPLHLQADAPPHAGWAGRLLQWVPIRSLAERHRERIVTHLRSLAPQDRYLRFGYAASDEQIVDYVAGVDFTTDEVFGIYNRRLELIALAHLAYARPVLQGLRPAMVEFGVSVLAAARGRGYGARLFDHAIMHARNRGTDKLLIHALTENKAMLRIARRAGATVERDGSESEAWLRLPPDTVVSQIEEVVETHAAEANYRFKHHALRLGQLIDVVNEVRAQVRRARRDHPA